MFFKTIYLELDQNDVRYVAIPKQRGSTDCGLFALAYAQLLLDQGEPSHYVFDQSKKDARII